MNDPNISAAALPPDDLRAVPNGADVWSVPIETDSQIIEDLRQNLSSDERARALRFRAVEHQELFVAGRGILRRILSCYARVRPESLVFRYGTKGKPHLQSSSGLQFNLGHSGGRAVYAVAGDDVGVDIELIKPSQDWQKISTRFFSPREAEELTKLDPSQKIAGFFACWTRKEAYIKAIGDGLAIPLSKFCVGADPLRTEGAIDEDGCPQRWYFKDLKLGKQYAGAVVTRFALCRIRFFNFERTEDCIRFIEEKRAALQKDRADFRC